VVVDNISYDFVKGATVDYVEELIRAAFVVSQFNLLGLCVVYCFVFMIYKIGCTHRV
jgi:Fe-S cluster assembly iron-binding protein IscA